MDVIIRMDVSIIWINNYLLLLLLEYTAADSFTF